jgi:hypothetical protein
MHPRLDFASVVASLTSLRLVVISLTLSPPQASADHKSKSAEKNVSHDHDHDHIFTGWDDNCHIIHYIKGEVTKRGDLERLCEHDRHRNLGTFLISIVFLHSWAAGPISYFSPFFL